ncbi:MAG: two-component regulator propeller domain-containing protein [Tenuifilaceae bacterium]|nr:two-component regulator propeller domain-containing protein [Tenuifilaceae bacterium]
MLRIIKTLVVVFLTILNLASQPVKHYSSDRDLSNSMITRIAQDEKGFIWISTEDGLNRFDGLKFINYRSIPNDSTSLTSNFVRTLFLDSTGKLWIGCINSLMVHDPERGTFKEVVLHRDTLRLRPHVTSIIELGNGDIMVATSGQGLAIVQPGQLTGNTNIALTQRLSSEFVQYLYLDSKERIWIGTENEGLNLYDPKTDALTIFQQQGRNGIKITSNYITSIAEDSKNNILVGTINGGINRFSESDSTFSIIPTLRGNKATLPVRSIFKDTKGNIWVGTDGLGLWQLNTDRDVLMPSPVTLTKFDVNKSKIHCISQDHEGNLWLGVYHKGVVLIPGKPNHFNSITYQQPGNRDLGGGSITTIAEGKSNTIWIGSDSDGIYTFDCTSRQIEKVLHAQNNNQVYSNAITSIHIDKSSKLWVGTALDGFFKYDPSTNQIVHFNHNQLNENSLSNDKVNCITQDTKGNLWVGTSGGGANMYNPQSGKFTRFVNNQQQPQTSLCNNWVNTIFCDSEGLIWMGTYNRLSVYNPENNTFRTLSVDNGFLPNNIIYYVTEDSRKNIWIGTNDGLVRYDKRTDKAKFFTTNDGLSNNVICAILEDNNEQLWISTHHGISCFSTTDGTFKNYFVHDGLQGNEFRRNSALKTQNGEFFFGGINGITWFVPEQIIRDQYIPEVYFTDLILYNRSVHINEAFDGKVILEKTIDNTETLNLEWHHKNFSLEFSTIGFNNPERISYQYRLVGFDKGWNSTGVLNRRATYTNLEPNSYVFEIRATDNDNYSSIRRLYVRITPPWWSTWWFKLIYSSFALFLIYFFYLYVRGVIRHRHELIQHEQHEKFNEAKLQFFTNISHEIRTPLTLIAGPLEKLIAENKDQKLSKSYMMMYKNTHRLMRLVNQLLDIRKIDRGQLVMKYLETDLVKFIADIMQNFDYVAEKKSIKFTFTHKVEELMVWIDPNNFDKVLFNVLSNAFKYTPNNGVVEIKLKTDIILRDEDQSTRFVKISVSDTGPGIPDDNLNRIFDRFYQVDGQSAKTGTGIGLHLSRSLIELQKGKIYAENRMDMPGSIFHILIPLGNAHVTELGSFSNEELASQKAEDIKTLEYIESTNLPTSSSQEEKPSRKPKPKILVADDDPQMLEYIKDELEKRYQIITCCNGKEAFEGVLQHKPNLIVSDVMMPVMDGIALCRKLKTNPETSHLPVILLTAKSQEEDMAEGLEIGADAYLTKPFNADLLAKNIQNLIANRERLKIKFSPGGNINATNTNVSSADQKLMERIVATIEEQISNPELTSEYLSTAVGMSRVHLFRKMKKITGQSPSDFIRKIRLQKAAQLIEGNAGFIKEIAFETGFTSLSHFSRSFHSFFGVKPSEFLKNKKSSNPTPPSNEP